MTRKSREIGRRWETAVVQALRKHRWPSARRNGSLYGRYDRGDIGEVPWTIQCKDLSELGPKRLAQIMDEAEQQARNNGTERYAIVLKRRGKSTGKAFWIIPFEHGMKDMENYEQLRGIVQ